MGSWPECTSSFSFKDAWCGSLPQLILSLAVRCFKFYRQFEIEVHPFAFPRVLDLLIKYKLGIFIHESHNMHIIMYIFTVYNTFLDTLSSSCLSSKNGRWMIGANMWTVYIFCQLVVQLTIVSVTNWVGMQCHTVLSGFVTYESLHCCSCQQEHQ